MFLVVFFILLAAWLVVWFAVHVTSVFVHLLIIAAVISLIMHFVRRRKTVP